MPLDTAELCEKWLTQRRELAARWQGEGTEEVEYGTRGRATPRAGEFTEGIVLVKDGADVEAVAKRIKDMGFETTTRASAFDSIMKELDTVIRFVKRIAFAFGAVLLGLACGPLRSAASRIVSGSRDGIGLLRALGAPEGDIRRVLLAGAVLVGV